MINDLDFHWALGYNFSLLKDGEEVVEDLIITEVFMPKASLSDFHILYSFKAIIFKVDVDFLNKYMKYVSEDISKYILKIKEYSFPVYIDGVLLDNDKEKKSKENVIFGHFNSGDFFNKTISSFEIKTEIIDNTINSRFDILDL